MRLCKTLLNAASSRSDLPERQQCLAWNSVLICKLPTVDVHACMHANT